MMKFFAGVVLGIAVATVGLQGLVNIAGAGIAVVQGLAADAAQAAEKR
jgi:hypothetical protein